MTGRAWSLAVVLAAGLTLTTAGWARAQLQYSSGQNIAPDFQGWEPNADGSFNFVFGYLNRNYEQRLHVPIGANNKFEPGTPDQGQPTYFLPRRNRDVFRVKVPKDFGAKEMVWTIVANGVSESAYASLKPDYALDARVIFLNNTGLTMRGKSDRNNPPVVELEGPTQRMVRVGEPLALTAMANDDEIPPARPAPPGAVGFRTATGLRVAWFVYRGSGDDVTFDPPQFKVYPDFLSDSPWTPGWAPPPLPPDGKFPVRVTFGSPGIFVLRALAHDGGFGSIQEVTVNVHQATATVPSSPLVR